MTRKKAFNWTIMFGLLAAFSIATVGGSFRSPVRAAMAKMQEDGNSHGKAYVVVNDEEHNPGFLTRFARLYEHNLICEVDAGQVAGLSAKYDTDQETMTIGSDEVQVVTVTDDSKLKSKEIRSFLKESGSDLHNCQVVKERNIFYMLFTAHTS